jgi:hypothetical protein
MSSNVESSQVGVMTFNRVKRSVLYLVLEYSKESEIVDTQI